MSAKRVKLELTVGHFSHDSFDRFGDDLNEEVLQYLTFSDKVRLECVSKQWKRCIFQRQSLFEFDEHFDGRMNTLNQLIMNEEVGSDRKKEKVNRIEKSVLESVLKKCPKMIKIILKVYIEGIDVSLFGKYCSHLKALELNCNYLKDVSLLEFAKKFGHKLKEIEFHEYCKRKLASNLKKFLQFCPNLIRIVNYTDIFGIHGYHTFIYKKKNFLPKLEDIRIIGIHYNNKNKMKILSDKYQKKIKHLEIEFSKKYFSQKSLNHEDLKTCLNQLSLFVNLRSLKLQILIHINDSQQNSVEKCLEQLFKNCDKMERLSFTCYSISNKFFNILSNLKSLERLRLDFRISKLLTESVECLKECHKLKHLMICCDELNENFFDDIHTYVPNLRTIIISANQQMSDNFYKSL